MYRCIFEVRHIIRFRTYALLRFIMRCYVPCHDKQTLKYTVKNTVICASLPINDAMELNAIKERIKIRLKRTAEDIIEIGKDSESR